MAAQTISSTWDENGFNVEMNKTKSAKNCKQTMAATSDRFTQMYQCTPQSPKMLTADENTFQMFAGRTIPAHPHRQSMETFEARGSEQMSMLP